MIQFFFYNVYTEWSKSKFQFSVFMSLTAFATCLIVKMVLVLVMMIWIRSLRRYYKGLNLSSWDQPLIVWRTDRGIFHTLWRSNPNKPIITKPHSLWPVLFVNEGFAQESLNIRAHQVRSSSVCFQFFE